MPRYSPLPSVSIDPRNEAELVQQASQRVYEASNQTLNDFSSGNPLAALIEGQAFAQNEFLFWANQLPDKILIEWIGPFLGAMRRLGTPAAAELSISAVPSDTAIVIPIGTTFTTDANRTGGESIAFVNTSEVIIPPGELSAKVIVVSQFVGSRYNVPANTIVDIGATGIGNVSVTNPLPAVGGSNVETYEEVQERFFTLIRRKNPVSAEDWQGFFTDLYGPGTLTSVQPNRPSRLSYNYINDYINPNGQVSFFVLGPDGVKLTPEQLRVGQRLVNLSVPVEMEGHLYPVTLSDVQYNMTVEVEANSSYGGDPKAASQGFRERLNFVLQPGVVFPANVDPTVSDVDSAFYSTFEDNQRYVNPGIVSTVAYNTPSGLAPETATYTQIYNFETGNTLLNTNDLVYVTRPVDTYYSVLKSFTPLSSEKSKQPVYGNLQLKQIKFLTPGIYSQGDVVYWASANGGDAELHIILQNLVIPSSLEIPEYIKTGQISAALQYSPWVVGNSYTNTVNGAYSPQLIQYDYKSDEFIPDSPSTDFPIPVEKRPGCLAWITSNNFVLQPSTDDFKGASSAGVLNSVPVNIIPLSRQKVYTAGAWVQTPQVGSGPNPKADPYYNYVDLTKGAVTKYAYVNATFTFSPREDQKISEYFDELVSQEILKEVVVQNADAGLPIYKYKARFKLGEYLEYRESSKSAPFYYIASQYFTPNSKNPDDMVAEGLIIPLTTTESQVQQLTAALAQRSIKQPIRMFTFFKGDRTFFREGVNVTSYTALESVTPLFAFNLYLENNIFVRTDTTKSVFFDEANYIPFFSPNHYKHAEDTIIDETSGNLYRVMRSFTPTPTVVNWTEAIVNNTPRIEEYQKNLLRYVSAYSCEEPILSQMGKVTSAIKLGAAQITIIPTAARSSSTSRENLTYVWEATPSYIDNAELSWFTGTRYLYQPPNYDAGTLSL